MAASHRACSPHSAAVSARVGFSPERGLLDDHSLGAIGVRRDPAVGFRRVRPRAVRFCQARGLALDRPVDRGRRRGGSRAQARAVRPRGADPGDRGRLHARRRLVRGVRPARVAPASRQPQRAADGRDGLPVLRVPAARPAPGRAREHAADPGRRLLDLPVRHADPDAADERAAADALRPPARGLVRDPARHRPGRVDDDRPRGGPPAARLPERGRRARDRPGPARHARGLLPGDRRRGRRQVVGVDAAAAPRAAAEPRRRLRAAVLRDAARQRPGLRNALADAAVDRGLLARDRAAGVPGRAAALAAGARRPRRPVPRARGDEHRRPAGDAPARARRSEPGAGAGGVSDRGSPAAPSRRSSSTGGRSPRSSTTPRSTRIPSCSRPPARRRPSRSRTSASWPRPTRGSTS